MSLEHLENSAAETEFTPVIFEQYAGDEYTNIDKLQSVWKRSLQYTLSSENKETIYDLILCCREAVLNALIHGCDSSPDKSCSFQVCVNDAKDCVRVQVDDPGHGHDFDLEERLQQLDQLNGKHLGLGIIKHVSDNCSIENQGSTVIFEFDLKNNVT